MVKRIQVTLPLEVYERLDVRAQQAGLSRSTYIASALAFKDQYDTMMEVMPVLSKVLSQMDVAGYLEKTAQEKGTQP